MQFCLATLQCWACGMFRLDPGAHELGDPEAALAVVLARCLEMGVSPSSNIAQRALTEILTSLSARFAASEEPHLLLLERRFPAFREARAARRALSERTGRDEARCHALLGYTDDVAAVLMGAAATVRYCAAHGRHLGPGGCNVTMAIPAKRTLGISVPFIGATALTVGQLAYISREKVHRTQLALASARDGSLALAEWVKLAGLLNHLVCVLLMPYYVMYGVYECLDDARTRGLGQDAHVEPTKGGLKALRRWSDALTTTAGTTALAALYPSRRPAGAGVLHVMHSDAAKEGTGAPAICGNLYSEIWVLPLRDEWRALPIVATEFVGGIINVMIFAPMLHGAPGLLVLDALVVPTVIAGKASSPLMRYICTSTSSRFPSTRWSPTRCSLLRSTAPTTPSPTPARAARARRSSRSWGTWACAPATTSRLRVPSRCSTARRRSGSACRRASARRTCSWSSLARASSLASAPRRWVRIT